MPTLDPWVLRFDELVAADVPRVGGKNASLGEMIRELAGAGIPVPPGFATTAHAYRAFVAENALGPVVAEGIAALRSDSRPAREVGATIRAAFLAGTIPAPMREAVLTAYRALGSPAVAVRSSATAEDLPTASFAGQQESFLNVQGEPALLDAVRRCLASLFTDRAIAYREANGFDHATIALSVGVQRMVRSDAGSAGVLFTLDTETGFPQVVLINAAWGLGESVVKGTVDPDELLLFKPGIARQAPEPILRRRLGAKERMIVLGAGDPPTHEVDVPADRRTRFALEDADAITLARWAMRIEEHYSELAGGPTPMDIEWAKDGVTGELFILQARPETVQSRVRVKAPPVRHLLERSTAVSRGRAVGSGIAAGRARVVHRPDEPFEPGSVLVTERTDPDWLPLMRRAAAIVTDHGGRTCHAAILSRELGIPAVVGTGNGTRVIADGQEVTVDCAGSDEGLVHEGLLRFEEVPADEGTPVHTNTRVMLNLADPGSALRHWRLPVDGIGLARLEFIIANEARVHPMALLHPEGISDAAARAQVEALRAGETVRGGWFIETVARGVATLAASQWPKTVIVRMSDFKTNEYAGLLGGRDFEPHEENPMIGFRGASRYTHERYAEGFRLECSAMRMARERIGLTNIVLMIPFCRTTQEADAVLDAMADEGLVRGRAGLQVYVMCEVPSNVILTEAFAARFDGFSIGSNDLTQLTLGVDRDSELLAPLFDERDPAVMALIRDVIRRAHRHGAPVGLCGQAPSDDPTFADFLVEAGIDSISVDPDSAARVRARVHEAEVRIAEAARTHPTRARAEPVPA